MATTIKQSFADYATNLEITDKQASIVGNCRAHVVKKIKKRANTASLMNRWLSDHGIEIPSRVIYPKAMWM